MRELIRKYHKKINWECGASSILFYLCLMWLIVLAVVLFVQLSLAFQGASKSQLFADVLADGSAYIGNNGWGLNEDDAEGAYATLAEFNSSQMTGNAFDNVEKGEIDYTYTKSDGTVDQTYVNKGEFNTVLADSTWSSELISGDGDALSKQNNSATRITYSGGMRIVLEAWHHTYQYFEQAGAADPEAGQVWYTWGGGHGGDDDSWKTYADCSGFVSGVYRECGYDVPSWSCTWDMESMGDLVAVGYDASVFDEARPGDIILYWWGSPSGTSAHVAIYAGEYNGVHYQVHSSGGRANSVSNPGKGSSNGAILAPCSTSAGQIMVRRIVDSTGTAAEITQTTIAGCTPDETTVIYTLKSWDYSNIAIAAILGNLRAEGTGYANAVQGHGYGSSYDAEYTADIKARNARTEFIEAGPGGGGYGMAQWTDHTRKGRLWDLSNGDIDNTYIQAQLIDDEMHTSDFIDVYNFINSTTSLDDATEKVYSGFEMPGSEDTTLSARKANAGAIYAQLEKIF